VAFWLKPIYNHIHTDLLQTPYLHCDETPVKVIDPDRKGKARKGYLWVLTAQGKDVVFRFETGRSARVLDRLLKNWQGTLHCDDYGAYNAFIKTRTEIILARCWAHVRRKFFEVREDSPRFVEMILRHIGHLYAVERHCREKSLSPKLRLVRRQSDSRMALKRLKRLLEYKAAKVLPSGGLGVAIRYVLSNWNDLTRFMEDGNVELDNNYCENTLRPTAVGKKNWLFIGHPTAGPASAIIYSLVESCKRHGVEPFEYLRDVLDRLPKRTNQDIAAFTPRAWAEARTHQANDSMSLGTLAQSDPAPVKEPS
jgi:transposase